MVKKPRLKYFNLWSTAKDCIDFIGKANYYLLLSLLFLTSCASYDCSNRAARLNAQYEEEGINVLIAVCSVGKDPAMLQQYHAYILKDTEIIDAYTEKIVKRTLDGCLIFDEPEILKPYMSEKQFKKEWTW